MTLVFGDTIHADGAGPKTHVLVIGVGYYPHLRGGDHPNEELALDLGQLSSPSISAQKFADWFLATPLNNPDAPLGSLEMLLAPEQKYHIPGSSVVEIEAANTDEIQRAFTAWDARCNAHSDNVAVFYFCGHGLERETLVLLPQDFGHSPVPWKDAIDFRRTYINMKANKAFTQLYFIDACREMPFDALTDPDFGGMALRRGRIGAQDRRIAPIIYATSLGRQAFGPQNGESYFTAALLDALSGKGAKHRHGRWVIHTESLGAKVRELVNLNNHFLEPRYRQLVMPDGQHADNRVLHYLDAPPEASLVVCCDPDQATRSARFYVKQNGVEIKHRDPAEEPWTITIPSGVYRIGALVWWRFIS